VTGLDPTDPRPPAEQIAAHLRAQIQGGDLAEGAKLPSTNQLVDQYGVASSTARRATGILIGEGLAIGKTGAGVFVRRARPMVQIGTQRYSRRTRQAGQPALRAEAEAAGMVSRQEIRELAEVPAPDWVAAAYGIEPGTPVFVRRRTELIDDEPHQLADSYYTLALIAEAPELAETVTGPGGGFARIEDAGWVFREFEERLIARMPGPEEIAGLQLPPGVPIVRKRRFAWASKAEGDPFTLVEAFESILRADRVELAYQFPAPE
jgi:GntR family transcriptional regulator